MDRVLVYVAAEEKGGEIVRAAECETGHYQACADNFDAEKDRVQRQVSADEAQKEWCLW
jgi:hypothetical protein